MTEITPRPITMTYTNYRGETAKRTIVPVSVYWGKTIWRPEWQWVLNAFDVEKQETRTFALSDCGFTTEGHGCNLYSAVKDMIDRCHIECVPDNGVQERITKAMEEHPARDAPAQTPYTYIGKDGKPVLARDLEDDRDRLIEALSDAETPANARVGIKAIAAERQRQVDKEGWTPAHDADHNECELAFAGAVYALSGAADSHLKNDARQAAIRELWPFTNHWFKATGGREDLVKAGALIAAEIDRLDRAALDGEDG